MFVFGYGQNSLIRSVLLKALEANTGYGACRRHEVRQWYFSRSKQFRLLEGHYDRSSAVRISE
jgi:hypothetical protein